MGVEILYFDGCPTYERAKRAVREVLGERGMETRVDLVAANTDQDAERPQFPGSPTLRAYGDGLFPVQTRDAWALGCGTYLTPDGLKGHPTFHTTGETLSKKGGADAERRL